MKIRIFSVIIVVFFTTVIIGAPNLIAKPKGTIIAAISGSPPHLDIQANTTVEMWWPAGHVYEQLFAWGADFAPTPMLAESYSVSEDNLKWTIKLRKGVRFHNGDILDADDVLASIERWRKVSNTGKTWGNTKVVKVNSHTIQIQLEKPKGTMLNDLSQTSMSLVIHPAEDVRGVPANELKSFVGTGPYQFEKLIPDQAVKLKAFPGYVSRGGKPNGLAGGKEALIENIEFRVIKEPSTMLAALLAGEIHVIDTLQSTDVETVRKNPNVKTDLIKPRYWWGYSFNFARKLGANLYFRQAVQAAINHDEIAMSVTGDESLYRLDCGISHLGTFWHSTLGCRGVWDVRDQEKAKRLLKKARYNGEELLVIGTKGNIFYDRMSTVLKSQLRAVGVNVKIDWYDYATLRQVRNKKDTWDVLVGGWGTTFDPNIYKQAWYKGTGRGWADIPELSVIMDQATEASDVNQRKMYYADMNRIITEQIPMIKAFDGYGVRAYRKEVSGYQEGFKMTTFWNVSLD